MSMKGGGGGAAAAGGFLMLQQSDHYRQLHTERGVQQQRLSAMRNGFNFIWQWVCFAIKKGVMVFHLASYKFCTEN
jgi:hypothetical protein